MSQVEDALNHHLQSFGEGNIDEVVADYTEDSVILSSLIKGVDNIRAFFSDFIGNTLPLGSEFDRCRSHRDGYNRFPLATWKGGGGVINKSFCFFVSLLVFAIMFAALDTSPAMAQDEAKDAKVEQLTVKERAELMHKIMKAFADKARKEGVGTTQKSMPVPAPLGAGCAACAVCASEAFAACLAAGGPEDPICEAAIAAISESEPWCYVSCYACFL